MDYMLDREIMAVGEVIYDGCQEQPVDLDINLPDYCPDIQRVLKCQIYPKIVSRNISGDRLMLEGSYTVKVLYLDPEGMCVRCTESSDTFSSDIALKQSADSAQIFAFPRVEYINCHATSPRRLDIHGAFSVCAKVVCQGQNEIVSNICGNDIEQQKKTAAVNSLVGFSQQQFGVDEILELGAGKPPADTIIRTDAFAVIQDFKITAGKLMLKGEISVKFLYTSAEENHSLEVMEYTVPFSQMLDCDGADDNCLCNIKLNIISVEAEIKNDYSGEKTFFDTQIKLYAAAANYKSAEITTVNDAYSKEYDININSKQKVLDNLAQLINENYTHKITLSADDNHIAKIIDIWNETGTASASASNEQILFKGKYSLCVLAVNAENKPFYFERIVEYEYSRPYSGADENLKCDAGVSVEGISYRITGDGVEVKTQLRLTAEIYSRCGYKEITDVTADETKPAARDKNAALIIYFADAGENLWDIAREYRTSVEAIKQENDIDGESAQHKGMLLIPV